MNKSVTVGVVLSSFVTFLLSFILQKYSTPNIHPDLDERLLDFTSAKGQEDSSQKSYAEDCLSRYESALYRKQSPYKPSAYLITKLRQYEALHKRCGPHTESYNRTVRKLEAGHLSNEHDHGTECKYLVRIPYDGLGNRILSLTSTFLYALLTDRVLLVYDDEGDTADLFCEPFPETTWLLPHDFPIRNRLETLNQESPECYRNMLNNHSRNPSFVYLHLIYTFDDYDKLFFCDQDQIFLRNASWVIIKSQFYIVPSLFLIKSFEQELATLFPEKETVFHFLGRYLFHPSNSVWELITRYYQTYLANSDEKIGIQIRTFNPRFLAHAFNFTTSTLEAVPDTILACSFENNLLPKISLNRWKQSGKSKSVIVTSLTSKYYEKIRDVYWEHSTANGDAIAVFQPSSEGDQKTGNKKHDRKAWAEIYLLSLTDKLVTSPWSTFGYVAQGLGGLRSWMLHMPKDEVVPNPPCTRVVSMEPCFHKPPSNGCKARTGVDTDASVPPYIGHCEDVSHGYKLVDPKVI